MGAGRDGDRVRVFSQWPTNANALAKLDGFLNAFPFVAMRTTAYYRESRRDDNRRCASATDAIVRANPC